jgi:PAS domain S-box-containing protein
MKPVNWEEAVAAMEAYQERLERALAKGGPAYDEAFDDPPAGLWAHELDTEKRIVRVSLAELKALGYTKEQMLGQPAIKFIVMQESSERALDQKLTGAKELKPFLRTFKKADGSAIALILCDRHIKDKKGRILGLRTVFCPAKEKR